jgi:hypothetical protein
MYTADWWWETQVQRDTRSWFHVNWRLVNAQSGGYTGSLELHVLRNVSLEFCWRQERVACIYDNSQSIIEAPPVALNASPRNGRSPANSDQERQFPSEAAGWAAVHQPTGADEELWRVLQTLTYKQHLSTESGYYNILCADGNFIRCKPALAASLADCTE